MIIVMGTIRAPAAAMDRLRAPMEAVIKATRAEDGCIDYGYGEDVLDPGLIRIMERWRDRAALEAHFKTPHMALWKSQREAEGVGERRIFVHQADDGEAL
jgi:quinol monooxygenase YgiN